MALVSSALVAGVCLVLSLTSAFGFIGHVVSQQVPCKHSSFVTTTPIHRLSKSTHLFGVKVTIRIVGRKTSEKWIEQGCKMYETRLKPNNVEVETEWLKSNEALVKSVQSDAGKSAPIVLLDPFGKESTSEAFTEKFYQWVEQGGSRLVFVIGGAEGLPEELRSGEAFNRKPILYSLSKLTFTHQFARLVLIEQIYRASEIRKGSGYHK